MTTAEDLVKLLAARHAEAVFVAECKMGESWGSGARRLDAWAMPKSWSPWTTIGYEVKVSRSDFLRDDKWHAYLPVCHELYFVCPPKLIDPKELPESVGLLVASGQRLVTKRKALRREPDPKAINRLMSYVLMSRSRIVSDMFEANRPEPAEAWRRWLEVKQGNALLGMDVSKRIQEIVRDARARAQQAERDKARLEAVEVQLEALGLSKGAGVYEVGRLLRSPEHEQTLGEVRRLARELLRATGGGV